MADALRILRQPGLALPAPQIHGAAPGRAETAVRRPGPHAATPADAPRSPEQEKLRRAAQDFESLLLGTMLRTMRETTKSLADSDEDSATGAGIMNDVMDEHLSTALAQGGGIGLGTLLGGQLEAQRRRLEAAGSATAPGSATTPGPGTTAGHPLPEETP